ncbi:hypothetical protein M9435_000084 [Picochlorum sp. BPE23]|nr:hypothetical protein M9435_000084 [Picochlorum sp. BPE23]
MMSHMQVQGVLGTSSIRFASLNTRAASPPLWKRVDTNRRRHAIKVSTFKASFASADGESMPQSQGGEQEEANEVQDNASPSTMTKVQAWFRRNAEKSAALRKKLISYGPAAVLAYGLFDGVSYSIAFAIAFLGYEARTGLNPTANVADIVKICILMWAGNNVTRPFRLAGAAALAPWVDMVMEKLKNKLGLPNKIVSFFILTFIVAAICLSGVGALIFSRWIQG